MQDFIIQNNSIMDFDFRDKRIISEHFHQNVELLYVLEGKLTLTVESEEFQMKSGDFIVINSNKKHSYKSEGEVLTGFLHINYNSLCNFVDMNRVMFYCNTTKDKHNAYEKIRKLINRVFGLYFDKSGNGLIYLNSIYYSILNILAGNFLVKNNDRGHDGSIDTEEVRINEIVNYLYANYHRPISLNDLSDTFFLTNAYLSKYIKNKLGMNFMDYLNNIRLSHAVDEMKSTKKSLMRIAMDNGFPNSVSFNKVFKAVYKITPSAYMGQIRKKVTDREEIETESDIRQKVKKYLENNSIRIEEEENHSESYITVDSHHQNSYIKAWNRMINIGLTSDLFRSDMQDHILLLKKELKFEYVRFWDIYSPEMYLDIDSPDGLYNFAKFDRVLDFFVENEIKPYIELGFKPIRLLRNIKDYMLEQERKILFKDLSGYKKFLQAFVSHFVNRYGMEEVEKWYFEQWNDPRLNVSDDHHEYFEVFEAAYHTLKSISSQIRLGGAGFDRSHGSLTFEQVIHLWKKRMSYPDFISLYCYPYVKGIDELETSTLRSQDPNFISNQVLMVHDVLNESGFYVPELHISEWNSTVSNRNCLNDSCFKGAYMVKNIIDNIGKVDFMGYWFGSDLFSEYIDSNMLLSGSGGLLTKDGIKKPAFYAVDFLNRMGKSLLGRNDNCIITTNGYDNYSVVCHNYKHPNQKYYMKSEDETKIENQYLLFFDNELLKLNFQIKNVKNGTYNIKTRPLNHTNGSVQDEWLRMGLSDNLNKQDINYLKQIATPRISIRTCSVTDGVLKFETVLQPQEIQYIHLLYQF